MKKINLTAQTSPRQKQEEVPQEKTSAQPQESKPTQTADSGSSCILKEHAFIIQKYIERPLLIHNRKFDIRVWCLVTQNLDLFVFKEGYLRLSSETYNINDIDNAFIHLTNNAVQQYSKNYGQFESGNQMSYADFQSYLDKSGLNCSVKNELVPKIQEYIMISMVSIRRKLNKNERKYCFELFGYDFILDEQFGVWLIEVNTNPCIEESSKLLQQYIPRMLDDAFKLTVDQLFPPRFATQEKEGRKPDMPANGANTAQEPHEEHKESNEKPSHDGNIMVINEESADEPTKNQDAPNSDPNNLQVQQAQPAKSFWHVDGYSDYENMFEFIINLNQFTLKRPDFSKKKK